MSDTSTREVLEDVLQLPVRSDTAVQLFSLIEDPDCDSRDLGRVLEMDPALATRAIYLANSPFYGLSSPVATASRAVTVLGLNAVRALAASAAFGLLDGAEAMPPRFWEHALDTAAALATAGGLPAGDAFCLGLVHDVGTALLYRYDREAWWEATDGLDGQLAREIACFGEHHAALGARALAAARFPEAFVDAVAHHHDTDGASVIERVETLESYEGAS